jgi:hypothetical protein
MAGMARVHRVSISAICMVLALSATSALAESSDGGRTSAGGLFMSSYTRPAVAPGRARAAPPRPRRGQAPSSLGEAVSIGAISPSEAANLQALADTQY